MAKRRKGQKEGGERLTVDLPDGLGGVGDEAAAQEDAEDTDHDGSGPQGAAWQSGEFLFPLSSASSCSTISSFSPSSSSKLTETEAVHLEHCGSESLCLSDLSLRALLYFFCIRTVFS